jgi:murein DD-endopeptidase MepM/ murein hydrolase activator NlpD
MQKQQLDPFRPSRPQKAWHPIIAFSTLINPVVGLLELDRLATHAMVLGLIAAVMTIGGVRLSKRQLEARRYVPARGQIVAPSQPQPSEPVVVRLGNPLTLPQTLSDRSGIVRPVPIPHTIIPDRTSRTLEIQTYTVQSGDTISEIALRFGLDPETIVWANSYLENNPDLIKIGEQLTVLPVNGVYHQVGGGDTIAGIAASFKVDPQTIVDYSLNQLDPETPTLYPGQWLVVPGGIKPYVPKYVSANLIDAPSGAQQGTGSFGWPASGTISQDYWGSHRAVDIAAWNGAPIYAADGGYVVAAGWDDSGYGRMAVIDHGNGVKTLYAHMSTIYISAGDEIAQGQQIGEMGRTGHATGPHLHFEVIIDGVQRNPWGFLP